MDCLDIFPRANILRVEANLWWTRPGNWYSITSAKTIGQSCLGDKTDQKEDTQWSPGKLPAKIKHWFVALTNFFGVNILTVAELKLQTLHQLTELKRDEKSVFLIASKSRFQNTSSYTQPVKGRSCVATFNLPHIGNLSEIYKSGDLFRYK